MDNCGAREKLGEDNGSRGERVKRGWAGAREDDEKERKTGEITRR